MAKSKRVMQVEHEGETMWLYDNGQIRNLKGHLKGQGEVPQSYIDGKKALEAEVADLPKPPPAPPEIKDPPMNDLQVVVNIGRDTPDGFEASFTKSKVIGSHNIKVISGTHRHQLQAALERIVLQSNDDLRAIRDAPLVEGFKKEAARDAAKAKRKTELEDLLKVL